MDQAGIRIGGVVLPTRVVLAPMSGVTDLPFRRLVRELGAGLLVSEMIASWAMIRENAKTRQMAVADGQGPCSVQLAGCDPAAMAEAALSLIGSMYDRLIERGWARADRLHRGARLPAGELPCAA